MNIRSGYKKTNFLSIRSINKEKILKKEGNSKSVGIFILYKLYPQKSGSD